MTRPRRASGSEQWQHGDGSSFAAPELANVRIDRAHRRTFFRGEFVFDLLVRLRAGLELPQNRAKLGQVVEDAEGACARKERAQDHERHLPQVPRRLVVVHALIEDRQPALTGEEGKVVLQFCHAAQLSAKEGREVRLEEIK